LVLVNKYNLLLINIYYNNVGVENFQKGFWKQIYIIKVESYKSKK